MASHKSLEDRVCHFMAMLDRCGAYMPSGLSATSGIEASLKVCQLLLYDSSQSFEFLMMNIFSYEARIVQRVVSSAKNIAL